MSDFKIPRDFAEMKAAFEEKAQTSLHDAGSDRANSLQAFNDTVDSSWDQFKPFVESVDRRLDSDSWAIKDLAWRVFSEKVIAQPMSSDRLTREMLNVVQKERTGEQSVTKTNRIQRCENHRCGRIRIWYSCRFHYHVNHTV